MKQTAVEFLHSEYKRIFGDVLVKLSQGIEIADALEQAKEIEKQQIVDSFNDGFKDSGLNFLSVEQYYNETFKK